jgi:hypothetical protein
LYDRSEAADAADATPTAMIATIMIPNVRVILKALMLSSLCSC